MKKTKQVIIYYECKGCRHRITKEQFIQLRFDYSCNGQLSLNRRCGYYLSDYKPVYKEKNGK